MIGLKKFPKNAIISGTPSGIVFQQKVTSSFHIEKENFDYNPFNAQGGMVKMWQLFGEQTEEIINELNEVLAS